VYKSLETLVGCGLAVKLTYGDGSARYDGRTDPHPHARCLTCGAVLDVPGRLDGAALAGWARRRFRGPRLPAGAGRPLRGVSGTAGGRAPKEREGPGGAIRRGPHHVGHDPACASADEQHLAVARQRPEVVGHHALEAVAAARTSHGGDHVVAHVECLGVHVVAAELGVLRVEVVERVDEIVDRVVQVLDEADQPGGALPLSAPSWR
jgi:hypothetical protein